MDILDQAGKNWCQQGVTINQKPCHGLPQAWGGSKSVCLFCIRPTDNFKLHLRTIIGVNKYQSNKREQKIQQLKCQGWN